MKTSTCVLLTILTLACSDDAPLLVSAPPGPDPNNIPNADVSLDAVDQDEGVHEVDMLPDFEPGEEPGDPSPEEENPEEPTEPVDPANPTPEPEVPVDTTPPPPPPPREPVVPGDPPPPPRGPVDIVVYTANVENLPKTADGCPGDWRDLYSYMVTQASKPDLFLVQQITDLNQLNQLTQHMSTTLGRIYSGVIAEANPRPFNSPCGAQKERQTNAIIFAVDRLIPFGAPTVWQSYKNVNGTCVLDTLSRTRGVGMKFLDMQSDEFVAAASIHWSTRNGPGNDSACAVKNVRETTQIFTNTYSDSTLWVFGGDTNEPDLASQSASASYNTWYEEANSRLNGPLGWVDPIWNKCQNSGTTKKCLVSNWTFRGRSDRRIDMLFARLAGGGVPQVLSTKTITFNQANAADKAVTGTDSSIGYSDHRSVRSRLRY